MSERDYESKAQFLEAVRDEGAVLDGIEYFTEGEGSATSYHARNEDGEVESVTKSEIEAVWDAIQGDDEPEGQDSDEEEPKEIHLGTLYYSKSNWDDDQHLDEFEDALAELGWEITGDVESGGYRIGAVER